MTTATVATGGGRRAAGLATIQKIGRSLMLPIAVLPAAGLLLRLGQDDLLGQYNDPAWLGAIIDAVGAAGGALFENLALIFAVGVAIGIARKADGSTALAAVVGYLVFTSVTEAMSPYILGAPAEGAEQELINYSVLGGILVGLMTGYLWQRYYRTKLPPYLAFFGGRRFVPIITAVAAIGLGIGLSFVYPAFDEGLTNTGESLAEHTVIGGGIYGFLNRLLIPFGLHHILNSFMWFVFGEFEGATGDLNRFFAGDPTAGAFMAGFFPILMFALPAAAVAIWQEARPEQRKVVGGIMLSAALTSFLTGVTEPLEFAFLFVAFRLFLLHAVLTGTSLAVANALDIHMGFTFSAGLFDLVLNWNAPASSNVWMLPVMGVGYAVIYYVVFRFAIRRWNLMTPGRERDETPEASADERSPRVGADTPATVTRGTTETPPAAPA